MVITPAIGIATHSLFVNPIRQANEKLQFGKVGDTTLYLAMRDYVERLKEMGDDETNQKLFQIIKIDDSKPPFLTGVLEAGEYGFARRIANKKLRTTSKQLTRDEADLRPYYFLLYLPDDKVEGKLFLQTFKGFGIQKLLVDYFQNAFKEQFPELRLKCNSFISPKLINDLVDNSKVAQITFEETYMPTDIANEVWPGQKPKKEQAGSLKVVLQPGYDSSFPVISRVKKLFKGELKPSNFINLDFITPNIIRVKLRTNGRDRTVTCASEPDLRPVFDFTGQIDLENGNPKFESIDAKAKELLDDLLRENNEGKVGKT